MKLRRILQRAPKIATVRTIRLLGRTGPNFASQSRVAFSSIALEHGLQIAWRGGNDLQYLGGRGLLLQRLAELSRALLNVVEVAATFSMAITA